MSKCKYWQFENLNGYRPMTLFYTELSVAEDYGANAVQGIFEICFDMAVNSGIAYLTELVLVLICKSEELYNSDRALSKIYELLWKRVDAYIKANFKGDKLYYYFRTLNICGKLI
jgi:hypothetical protein